MIPANLIMERRDGGEFLRGSRERVPDYDSATEVHVVANSWPPVTGERWDGADGLRPATQAELEARAATEREIATEEALRDLGANTVLLRVVFHMAKQIEALGGDLSAIPPLANAQSLGDLKRLIAEQYGR